MPVMDGLTFLEHFRNYQEYNNIPVIVATSNDDEGVENNDLFDNDIHSLRLLFPYYIRYRQSL